MDEHIPKAVPASLRKQLSAAINMRSVQDIHKNFYQALQEDTETYDQGNGVDQLPHIEIGQKNRVNLAMIISNSCDTTKSNKRTLPPRVTYCGVLSLAYIESSLKALGIADKKVQDFVRDLRQQVISDILFLPKGSGLKEDCVALFSFINSADIAYLDSHHSDATIRFALSYKAKMLLLTKLSIHYLRAGDQQPSPVDD